ncbi:site-specific DNA-methyltransferase [Salinicoccus roseus]|uniref:DNA-methyltransferase n=1 Tax=Salinicoccus roseus TaxID=45670 RepID=UPI001CA60DC0|nr:site-specific DNA-methyltransferase [Salinicoccus roseus]MBY8908258.1 site-specific DNA-methyltransferase [Salinicoccus roseus]
MILQNGDCLSEMKKIKSESIDLILTDPPYNLGLFMSKRQTNLKKMRDNFFGSAGWDDLDTEEWTEMMEHFFEESKRVLKIGGTLLIFMSVIKVETIIKIAAKYGFYYKTTGIWHKTNPMPRNMNLHFVNSNECWIYFIKDKKTGVFNNVGLELDYIESSVTPKAEKRHGAHPTQKPVFIMKHFIELLTNEGGTVLDPFMGSGTTAVASVLTHRKFIGIELSEEYYEVSKKRVEEVYEKTLFGS